MTHFKHLASCLLVATCYLCRPVTALSDSVCLNVAATWMSSSSHLSGQFPYYSLMFFCQGDLNLESRHADACINHGSSCGQPAADEFCQYLGFEGAAPTLFTTTEADAPARSMTGEWCVEAGNYQDLGYLNRTQLEAVNASASASGQRCERLDSVVCFNSRDRLAQNMQHLHPTEADAPSALEQPSESSSDTDTSGSTARSVAGPTQGVRLPPASSIGGRRLLTHSA